MYFTGEQEQKLQDLIRNIEDRAGIELVAAVVGKCDSYPEIPWKAFALAAALGVLAHMVAAVLNPELTAAWSLRLAPLAVLGTGAALALLTILWPAFGRLFLDHARAEAETEQYARAFFLERELFRTVDRIGILILVGLFERRVVILPDTGIAGRLDPRALEGVIRLMTPHLRRKDRYGALAEGLPALEAELLRAGFGPGRKSANELADEIIQDRGEDR